MLSIVLEKTRLDCNRIFSTRWYAWMKNFQSWKNFQRNRCLNLFDGQLMGNIMHDAEECRSDPSQSSLNAASNLRSNDYGTKWQNDYKIKITAPTKLLPLQKYQKGFFLYIVIVFRSHFASRQYAYKFYKKSAPTQPCWRTVTGFLAPQKLLYF